MALGPVLTVATALAFASCDPSVAPERYLIVDSDARQDGVDGFPGCLFLFDRGANTVEPFVADARFLDPQMAILDGADDLLVVDFAAHPVEGGGSGAVFRVDLGTRTVTDIWSPPSFRAPCAIARGPGDRLYVVDRWAIAPPGKDGSRGRGALLTLDLATGACRVLCDDERLSAPAFALVEENGDVLLLDADAKTGDGIYEGVFFRVSADDGKATEVGKLDHGISPLSMLREPDGALLVFDVNADVEGLGVPLGAIFRFRLDDGSTELVASSHTFRDPIRGVLAPDGSVLVIDANADPEGRGPDAVGRGQNVTGGGAILRLDPKTGAVSVVTAPPEFVNPVCILRLP